MKIRQIRLPSDNEYDDYDNRLSFDEAFIEGWLAHHLGLSELDNPYPLSGHERDTTFMDQLNYFWWKGFDEYKYTYLD